MPEVTSQTSAETSSTSVEATHAIIKAADPTQIMETEAEIIPEQAKSEQASREEVITTASQPTQAFTTEQTDCNLPEQVALFLDSVYELAIKQL